MRGFERVHDAHEAAPAPADLESPPIPPRPPVAHHPLHLDSSTAILGVMRQADTRQATRMLGKALEANAVIVARAERDAKWAEAEQAAAEAAISAAEDAMAAAIHSVVSGKKGRRALRTTRQQQQQQAASASSSRVALPSISAPASARGAPNAVAGALTTGDLSLPPIAVPVTSTAAHLRRAATIAAALAALAAGTAAAGIASATGPDPDAAPNDAEDDDDLSTPQPPGKSLRQPRDAHGSPRYRPTHMPNTLPPPPPSDPVLRRRAERAVTPLYPPPTRTPFEPAPPRGRSFREEPPGAGECEAYWYRDHQLKWNASLGQRAPAPKPSPQSQPGSYRTVGMDTRAMPQSMPHPSTQAVSLAVSVRSERDELLTRFSSRRKLAANAVVSVT